MKKILSILIVAIMLIGMMPAVAIPAFAEVTSGTTGDCTWTLDGTELTISGNGAMGDYGWNNAAPWGTSITKIIIEEGVTYIDDYAFSGCENVASIYIFDLALWCETNFHYRDGVCSNPLSNGASLYLNGLLVTNLIIPEGITTIGVGIFYGYKALTSVVIPDCVEFIGDYAFEDCTGLFSMTIGDGVKIIGDGAFENCYALESIVIPDKVTTIGYSAFRDCSSLISIIIPNNVVTIDHYAFDGCSLLSNLILGNKVSTIGISAFGRCPNITSLTIPDSVTVIGERAFGSGLISVSFGNGIISIGEDAFGYCYSLERVYVSDISSWCKINFEKPSFEDYVSSSTNPLSHADEFYVSGELVTDLVIPEGVTSIGQGAFCGYKGLNSVTIPESVETIGNSAFAYCSNLKEIECLASVNSIPASAFNGCSNIKRIYLPSELTLVYSNTFNNSSLRRVFYGGTRQQYETMTIQHTNDALVNAKWSFNETGLPEHSYTNVCDKECNECGMLREVDDHSYDNACDTECNRCGDPREVSHFYDNACDAECNECHAQRPIQGHWYDNGCDKYCNLCYAPREITHSYTNACDIDCNVCNAIRRAPHVFAYECSTICLVCEAECYECGAARDADHIYDNACDATCNICNTPRTVAGHQYDHGCDADCNNCGMPRSVSHSYANATCTAPKTCTVCGATNGSALGHTYANACDADCNVCGVTRTPAAHTGGTATCKEQAKCAVCGVVYGALGAHQFGDYLYNNDATTVADGTKTRTCSVCGAKDTVAAEGTKLENPFTDVKAGKYYAEPVLWAVEKEITKGLNETTFGPDQACTRGHIVTFLWRAAGSPEPKSTTNPFTDVQEGKFYYKAVLWAVENGITKGLTDTTFGPGNTCTRGQVVTFLWRAKGGEKVSASNPFTDVNKGFYVDAVAWAVKNEITSGTTATTFSPANNCTRGQIVTFLYRAYK